MKKEIKENWDWDLFFKIKRIATLERLLRVIKEQRSGE